MSEDHSFDSPLNSPVEIDRRRFLKYAGAGAGAIFTTLGGGALGTGSLLQLGCAPSTAGTGPWVRDGRADWMQPPYPVPLLGTSPDQADAEALATFEVVDDLVLPKGFRYSKIAECGETFGAPGNEIRFGYNNDYTGLLKIDGTDDQYWLFVNHEYVSARPWLEDYKALYGTAPPVVSLVADPRVPMLSKYGIYTFDGYEFPEGADLDAGDEQALAAVPADTLKKMRALAADVLREMGISVLRVRRLADGAFEVVRDAPDHRRITAFDRQNVAGTPDEHSRFTGPAAWLFESPPRGTMSNCSGGTTPWGTFLTCEENYQNDVGDKLTPDGREVPTRRRAFGSKALKVGDYYDFNNPLPLMLRGNGEMLDQPLDGREYGWVCEVSPENGHLSKHTALGRFRHENVALRADAGKPLAAYMGDDRRGGHIWKFVSDDNVVDPKDPANSRLLEKGTLYVARFHEDFTGEWIPLTAETPLRRPEPEFCFSHHVRVPARFVGGSVKVGDTERDQPAIEVDHWMEIIESFTGKPFAAGTLGDLVKVGADESLDADALRRRKNGILSMDAFLMANACGGTPSAPTGRSRGSSPRPYGLHRVHGRHGFQRRCTRPQDLSRFRHVHIAAIRCHLPHYRRW